MLAPREDISLGPARTVFPPIFQPVLSLLVRVFAGFLDECHVASILVTGPEKMARGWVSKKRTWREALPPAPMLLQPDTHWDFWVLTQAPRP